MGLLSRRKGAAFERKIATLIRARFPHLKDEIRRSIQSRAAEESDVTGLPGFWLECQMAERSTPLGKLLQAIDDCPDDRIPVAVTMANRSRLINATMSLVGFGQLIGTNLMSNSPIEFCPVTISFAHFLEFVAAKLERDSAPTLHERELARLREFVDRPVRRVKRRSP